MALVEQSLAGPRKLWGHGLRNAFYWLGPPSLDHAPGLGSFCIPSWCPSSRLVCTRSRAVLGRGESGVRAFTGLDCGMHQTEAGCGKPAATTADLSLPPALGLFSMCRPPHKCTASFSRHFIWSKHIPSSQGGLSTLCGTPATGHPVSGFSHSLPRAGIYSYNLPCPLSPFPGGTRF